MSAFNRGDVEASGEAAAQAQTMLESSSSSVTAELDLAEGWLRDAPKVHSEYWNVNAMAGALGALCNAWGRLTLWARANGTWEPARSSLDACMNKLVDVHRGLMRGAPTEVEVQTLEAALRLLSDVHSVIEAGNRG